MYWVLSYGTPSTTKRGWLFPKNEELPLMVIRVALPGIPVDCLISTPGILPESDLKRSGSEFCRVDSESTCETAYPNAFVLLEIPTAVTTTSSRPIASVCKVTL